MTAKDRRPKSRAALLRALLRAGTWQHMRAVQKAGGWRYSGRLHEIRRDPADPWAIEHRRNPDGSYSYRRILT